jgi:hypothetical protein
LSSLGRDEDIRRRILGNARAAESERLRNVARVQLGADASDDEVQARAAELLREKLSAAGRLGRARQAARMAEADRLRAAIPEIELLLLAALDLLRTSAATGEVETAA